MNELVALLARQLRTDAGTLRARLAARASGEAPLQRCLTIADLRARARRMAPGAVFDFVDGAAGSESTAARNEDDLAAIALRPRMLAGVREVALGTKLLGRPVALPIAVSPTGLTGLVRPEGEVALARAAHAHDTVYVLSCMASHTLEEVAELAPGPRWFQLYLWRDRGLVAELVARAAAAGYEALVVTVDVPVSGARERDLRNGFGVPPRLTLRTLAQAARRPRWSAEFARDPRMRLANIASSRAGDDAELLIDYVARQFDPGAGWEYLAWLRERWPGPLVVKGILRADDAQAAIAAGADAVWVSNHGGRQLDGAVSSIRALPAVADAVGDRAEVFLDGGVRNGSDVLRALALGARAVMVGRPVVYGLAAGGRQGAERALTILREDLARACVLAGVGAVAEATGDLVAPSAADAASSSP